MLIVLVAMILLFIWVNSILPAELSNQESGWVRRLLRPVLGFIYSGRLHASLDALAARLPEPLGTKIKVALEGLLTQGPTYLVRKAAHFSEYALLGLFVELLCVSFADRLLFFIPEGLCLAAALIDEGIQLFSDGRSAQLRDVCIDLSGATLGLLIAMLALVVVAHIKRRK